MARVIMPGIASSIYVGPKSVLIPDIKPLCPVNQLLVLSGYFWRCIEGWTKLPPEFWNEFVDPFNCGCTPSILLHWGQLILICAWVCRILFSLQDFRVHSFSFKFTPKNESKKVGVSGGGVIRGWSGLGEGICDNIPFVTAYRICLSGT